MAHARLRLSTRFLNSILFGNDSVYLERVVEHIPGVDGYFEFLIRGDTPEIKSNRNPHEVDKLPVVYMEVVTETHIVSRRIREVE